MTLHRVWMPSPNYSSRGGASVRLIVLHTAEGALTIQSLGNYFASSGSGVSSHAGADDTANTVGEYVARGNKAWTASNANPVAVQIELCAFASWSTDDWNAHPTMLANTAAWIAEEAAAFGIPIVKLSAAQAQGGAHGVCQHNDLGSWGGGHWDCGPAFPMDRVLEMAKGGAPEPPKPKDEDMTPAVLTAKDGRIWYFATGTNREVWAKIADVADWFSLGGTSTAGVDAAQLADGSIRLVIRGTDGALWAKQSNREGDFYGAQWWTEAGGLA